MNITTCHSRFKQFWSTDKWRVVAFWGKT